MTDQSPANQVPDEPLDQVAQRLDSLIQAFEQHPIVQVRDQVMEMLGLIDTLHRHGLQHLVEVLQRQVPALFEQAQEDQPVRMLLILYDLMPSEQLEAPAP